MAKPDAYVIHKPDATTLHHDLRLEIQGKLGRSR